MKVCIKSIELDSSLHKSFVIISLSFIANDKRNYGWFALVLDAQECINNENDTNVEEI